MKERQQIYDCCIYVECVDAPKRAVAECAIQQHPIVIDIINNNDYNNNSNSNVNGTNPIDITQFIYYQK